MFLLKCCIPLFIRGAHPRVHRYLELHLQIQCEYNVPTSPNFVKSVTETCDFTKGAFDIIFGPGHI